MVKNLRLLAIDNKDLEIIAAACQDALFLAKDAVYSAKSHRFSISLNRFVWEKENSGERIAAILSFEGVLGVKAKGINPNSNIPLSILTLDFIADKEPPSGEIIIKFANNYEIALKVECIDITLADIGAARPARAKPNHEE